MGPGMFDGLMNGVIALVAIFVVIAFAAGAFVNSCVTHVGHPTVGWSK